MREENGGFGMRVKAPTLSNENWVNWGLRARCVRVILVLQSKISVQSIRIENEQPTQSLPVKHQWIH